MARASRPIRVSAKGSALSQAIRSAGSLKTFASLMILPAPSTTQTLEASNDTSIPA
jgi:hypothetical protein